MKLKATPKQKHLQHVVIAQHEPAGSHKQFTSAQQIRMTQLSIAQLVIGSQSMAFGSQLLSWEKSSGSYTGGGGFLYGGYGVLIGSLFLCAGLVGVVSTRRNNTRWIHVALIWNILCASLFWIGLIAFISARLYSIARRVPPYESSYINIIVIAYNSVLIVSALTEFILATWSAVLCHRAAGTCCRGNIQSVLKYNVTPTVRSQFGISDTECPQKPTLPDQQLQLQEKDYVSSAEVTQQPISLTTHCSSDQSEPSSDPGSTQLSQAPSLTSTKPKVAAGQGEHARRALDEQARMPSSLANVITWRPSSIYGVIETCYALANSFKSRSA